MQEFQFEVERNDKRINFLQKDPGNISKVELIIPATYCKGDISLYHLSAKLLFDFEDPLLPLSFKWPHSLKLTVRKIPLWNARLQKGVKDSKFLEAIPPVTE